jgi:hypothetical protein
MTNQNGGKAILEELVAAAVVVVEIVGRKAEG